MTRTKIPIFVFLKKKYLVVYLVGKVDNDSSDEANDYQQAALREMMGKAFNYLKNI